MNLEIEKPVKDAATDNWVDLYAPVKARPFLRLARADRPIGSWLLFLPCLWSILLALLPSSSMMQTGFGSSFFSVIWLVILFAIGSIAMRGAGCTYNDIVDRDIDAKVSRTRSRPIPSGQVSVKQAVLFLVLQCLIGLAVLMQMNTYAIALGLSSLLIVLAYPFMKRITNWPQAVLGCAFSWGALMGWAALKGDLSLAPVLLYVGAVFWVMGYDTIYAHQDTEDDAMLGLGSTALNFGDKTHYWLIFFYSATFVLLLLSGFMVKAGLVFYGLMIGAGVHLLYQVKQLDIDNPGHCLLLFKSNRDFGFIVALALGVELIFSYGV